MEPDESGPNSHELESAYLCYISMSYIPKEDRGINFDKGEIHFFTGELTFSAEYDFQTALESNMTLLNISLNHSCTHNDMELVTLGSIFKIWFEGEHYLQRNVSTVFLGARFHKYSICPGP